MTRLIQVFEHEKLTLHEDASGRKLDSRELASLYDFNDRNDHKYFTGIRDGVKFTNYVGVIQVGGLTIEILPKSDRDSNGLNDYHIWHRVLLDMLRICQKINVNAVSESNLRRRHHSILDLYFELYLDEVEQLMRQGLVKKYRRQADNASSLKGQLLFAQQIQKNLIHQERFFTKHQVYDQENLVNQILLEGLYAIADFTRSPEMSQRCAQLIAFFPTRTRNRISEQHFNRLGEDRTLSRYQRALNIARMLLLNYAPDIHSGKERMLALLFDMNALWEEYVYHMLMRVTSPEIQVKPQQRKKFWNSKVIKPDIVVTRNISAREEMFVIDTKWKVLDARYPKPSDDDLKQMFVYNEYWSAAQSMLLYPTTYEREEVLGHYWSQDTTNKIHACKLAFVSVLNDDGELNLHVGRSILSKLQSVSH